MNDISYIKLCLEDVILVFKNEKTPSYKIYIVY